MGSVEVFFIFLTSEPKPILLHVISCFKICF